MKTACMSLFVLGSALWSLAAEAETVVGVGRAVSGDLIEVGSEVFFLNGIVVPTDEKGSRTRMTELVANQQVVCEVQTITQGSHRTAMCSIDGNDVSSQMVRSGLAIAYPENGVDLSPLQTAARDERMGIWAGGEFERLATDMASGSASPRDCTIKGNKGHRAPYDLRYHMPDTAYYGRTRINPRQGEKWFCSEDDAKAAGFASSAR